MKDELEDRRTKKLLASTMHDIEMRIRITQHPAVEDWEQKGDGWVCYLARGYFIHRHETEFEVESLEAMLEVINSRAIDVVDNP